MIPAFLKWSFNYFVSNKSQLRSCKARCLSTLCDFIDSFLIYKHTLFRTYLMTQDKRQQIHLRKPIRITVANTTVKCVDMIRINLKMFIEFIRHYKLYDTERLIKPLLQKQQQTTHTRVIKQDDSFTAELYAGTRLCQRFSYGSSHTR